MTVDPMRAISALFTLAAGTEGTIAVWPTLCMSANRLHKLIIIHTGSVIDCLGQTCAEGDGSNLVTVKKVTLTV